MNDDVGITQNFGQESVQSLVESVRKGLRGEFGDKGALKRVGMD